MPKDSPPVFGEQKTSTECSSADLVLLRQLAEEDGAVAQFLGEPAPLLVHVAGPADEQPQAGPGGREELEGAQQDRQALARLVHPAEETDRPALARPAVERLGVPVAAGGHPVGDQHRVAAQVLDERRPRRLGHRDPAVDLLKRGAEHRLGGEQHPGLAHRGVHGRHDRAGRHPAGEQRQRRHRRLVHVQHVEIAVAEPAADPAGRQRAEREPGHRAVVRHRHRPARWGRRRAAAAGPRRRARSPRRRGRARSAPRPGP